MVLGDKRAYCEILEATRTGDGQGGYTSTWSNAGYEWFKAVPLSQSRTLDEGGVKYRLAVEFTGNKRSDLEITTANKIVWESVEYTINSVVPSPKLDEIKILAYA